MLDSTVEAVISHLYDSPLHPPWLTLSDWKGGQTNTVSANATANVHRDAQFFFHHYVAAVGITEEIEQWQQGIDDIIHEALPSMGNPVYASFADQTWKSMAPATGVITIRDSSNLK